MKRTKRLTKREKKALDPSYKAGPNPSPQQAHIHCVACGRHIDPDEFTGPPATATWITCEHGSQFASCVNCVVQAETLIAAHDRTGNPVKTADAWH